MQESSHHAKNVVLAVTLFWLCCSSIAVAADNPMATDNKKPQSNQFPPNPLEINTPDPLLPQPIGQPLSAEERQNLEAALDDLDAQATAKLKTGDKSGAFDIWNRELRLRRALGSLAEVEALGRVGAIAWNENRRTEVQIILRRVQAIQKQQAQLSFDFKLQQSLAQAYQQIRSPQDALSVYQQILQVQRQQHDTVAAEATLKTIAELDLSWFNYNQAAASYQELLKSARAKGDRPNEVAYIQQLAYIYDQAKQFQQAVAMKQQLADIYLNEQDLAKLPALRLEIAADYEALKQLPQAFQNYQEAYASAWSLQQYYRAGDALRKLIALYHSQGQIDEVLEASRILLEADQLADNTYDMMNTYDQIGQIYLKRGNQPAALAAFQQGLKLAQQLQYRESYFAQQVQQLRRE